jgi:N utilization substance protein A
MAKEILTIVDSISNAKSISREKVFEALEVALATATKKNFGGLDVNIKVDIDRKTGDYVITRRWLVVDTDGPLENPAAEISLVAAKLDDENVNPGDYVSELLDDEQSVNSSKEHDSIFDRITVQTVKQVLQQKVRDAERQQVIDMFRGYVGKILIAIVKKVTREVVYLDLGNNGEGILRKNQMLPRDSFRTGDRIRCLLLPIKDSAKGAQLEVSRTSVDFLKELLTIEVPEIGEGQLEIINVVRDPGSRSKVAIKAKDKRIDPRGACIGMKGSRIKNVSDELCHEKVDIIVYDEDFSQYVINAMEPAVVRKVYIDQTKNVVEIGVEKDLYALAIGSNGQNVKLASQLLGWKVNVMTIEDMDEHERQEVERISHNFSEVLNIDEDFANALVDGGFSTVEEIAYVDRSDVTESIDGVDDELAEQLQNLARNALVNIETPSKKKVSMELINLDGMDNVTARALAAKEIATLEDLADQVVDDLIDIPSMDSKRAGDLILAARNLTWFKDEPKEQE